MFEGVAERKIRQAIENKELDNLEGMFKPLVFDDLDVPAEVRASYKILKNAGVLPEEMQLKKEIYNLEQVINSNILNEEQRATEKQKLYDKIMKYQEIMKQKR